MDAHDALFEDMQAIGDDADALGLTDVAMVLEFAMDVYLRETGKQAQTHIAGQTVERLKRRIPQTPHQDLASNWSMSSFPLAQVFREAS